MNTTMNIWDPSNETIDREDLAQLQLERLQASTFRAYRNVAFYRKRFDELGFAPEDIQCLDDLRTLPFTTKEDLSAGYPYDMLAVPLREVVRLHSSAWTSGHPVVCAYTRNDLRHWHEAVARILTAGGVTREDVVQIFFSSRMLIRDLGFHGGAERIGASVIPASPGGISQQVDIMQDFKTTAIVGTPSAAAQLLAVIAERGLDVRRLSLRVGIFGGEPWPETLREQLERELGIIALDNYGFAEVGGPGVAGECPCKCGLHLAEDQYLAEIIDPQSGRVLPPGAEGELVITTLAKEALPLLRFRTHDLTRLEVTPCQCGRTLARIARVHARTDDLLFVQGMHFHPAKVAAILAEIEGAQPDYRIILERKEGMEEIEVLVELLPGMSTDSPGKILAIEQRIALQIDEVMGITPRVRLVESQTIARLAEGSASHVIDKRI
ncbi:MAG: phenylacetate--CoA ligase family protein [Armatimonadota bacterium]